MVDYPGEVSLKQIYGTYNRAVLKVVPTLELIGAVTDAMVAFYLHRKAITRRSSSLTCTVPVS